MFGNATASALGGSNGRLQMVEQDMLPCSIAKSDVNSLYTAHLRFRIDRGSLKPPPQFSGCLSNSIGSLKTKMERRRLVAKSLIKQGITDLLKCRRATNAPSV